MFARLILVFLFYICSWQELLAQTEYAILIIDMQERFLQNAKPSNRSALVANQIRLLDFAKKHKFAVLVFQDALAGPTIPELKEKIDQIENKAYINKAFNSGFDERNRDVFPGQKDPYKILQEWGTKKLIASGVHGPACVACTVRSTMQLGLEVWTSADLVGNFAFSSGDFPNDSWWPTKQEDPGLFRAFQNVAGLTSCALAKLSGNHHVSGDTITNVVNAVRFNRMVGPIGSIDKTSRL